MKYLKIKEMPKNLVSISWVEDTEFPFIKKKVAKSADGTCNNFFSSDIQKIFVDSYGNPSSLLDDADLRGTYFSHNEKIYYVDLGEKISIKKNPPESVKAGLGTLDTNQFFKDLFRDAFGKWNIYLANGYIVALRLRDLKLVDTRIYGSDLFCSLCDAEAIENNLFVDKCPPRRTVIMFYSRLKKLAEKLIQE